MAAGAWAFDNMNTMTTSEIDHAILSASTEHWLKVARIIIDACNRLGLDTDDAAFDLVLGRIQALVSVGRLVAQGDTSQPRYSEVRLP